MLLLQMTGLSGAGKSTLSLIVQNQLISYGFKVEVIDGDEYRTHLCNDLGYSKSDRIENIRRLGFIGMKMVNQGVIAIIAAINPYEEARQCLEKTDHRVKTVYVSCPISTLIKRDPKGLYKKALLPISHPEEISNFSGISDPYEVPSNPDIIVETNIETIEESSKKILDFVLKNLYLPLPDISASNSSAKALYIGRWQPFHNGHKWLIDKKLKNGIPVLIAVRDLPRDNQNPFTTQQTIEMIRVLYLGQDVEVIPIPDIESINYGRTVGYEVNYFPAPDLIGSISATAIREEILSGVDSWKNKIDTRIHSMVLAYITEFSFDK